MDTVKRITSDFMQKGCGFTGETIIQYSLEQAEKKIQECNEALAEAGMRECTYVTQPEAITGVTEDLLTLINYVTYAQYTVYEELDSPLKLDFQNNATETLSQIILEDISTENTFQMEEHNIVNTGETLYCGKRVKSEITFEDFFGLTDVRAEEGMPVLENVETIGEFSALFRADYDTMKPEDMDIDTFMESYLTYGEYDHKAYHPGKDFLSAVLDITIVKPLIEICIGEDLITGERLTDFEKGMKAVGVVIDLFTLGQAFLADDVIKAGVKGFGKVFAVEMLSNAAGLGVGTLGDMAGLPMPLTWLLSMAAGGSVSLIGGKYLFKNADGVVRELAEEEVEVLLKNSDELLNGKSVDDLLEGIGTGENRNRQIKSFAELMSPEDAEAYTKFLKNGSMEGLTQAEIEGIKRIDELKALNLVDYQDILDMRKAGNVLEDGSDIPKAFQQQVFCSSYEERIGQTPCKNNSIVEFKNYELRGESLCTLKPPPDVELQEILSGANVEGVQYRNGVPDFSPFAKAEFEIEYMVGGKGKFGTKARGMNFAQADKKLAEQLNNSPEMAKSFGLKAGEVTEKDIRNFRKNNKYTWHELNDCKTVQLVPSKINSAFGHLGGVGEISAGAFEEGGFANK